MNKTLVLERQFQSLSAQNQVLRGKAKKINEIQTYVNILMQSSQNCQDQLTRANSENSQLKNKIDHLMAEHVRLQKTYENQFSSLQKQFKRQLAKKQQETRILQNQRQKDSYIFDQTLNQSQSRSKSDVERLKLHISHIQSEYQAQIKKLTHALSDKSKDMQSSQESKSQMKKAFIEQSNNLRSQIDKLTRFSQEKQNQNFLFRQQLQKLCKFTEQTQRSQSRLKKQLDKTKEEYVSQKRNSEKNIKNIQQKLNDALKRQSKLQFALNQALTSNEKLKQEKIHLNDESQDIKTKAKKLQRQLNQKQQEIRQSILKNQQNDQQFKRNAHRHVQQLKRVEEELTLTNERFMCEKRNCDSMKCQVQDLIKVIDKLQQNLSQNDHRIQMLNKENEVLFKQIQINANDLKVQAKQLNEYADKFGKVKQNCMILEELYAKESSKSKTLQSENQKMLERVQTVTKQTQILQDQQIQNLIERSLSEKRDILENHLAQKQNLIRKYQFALKQKDEMAKNRLQLLEDQINLMRVRH